MLDGLKSEGEAPPLDAVGAGRGDPRRGQGAGGPRRRARTCSGSTPATASGAKRASALVAAAARRLKTAALGEALRHAARIDRTIKGLARGDVWDELLQLCLRFAHS